MRIRRKTIWDKNMTARKKTVRRMLRAGHRESDAVEWYTQTDWEWHTENGSPIVWDDICFPSKKYPKICYVALLQTSDIAAEEALDGIMDDMTAQLLGYADYHEYCEDTVPGRKERARQFRQMSVYDKKNGVYHVNPLLFEPARYQEFNWMSFREIRSEVIWPRIRPDIETLTPPIYSTMKLEAEPRSLTITQALDCRELTIEILDKYVLDFWNSGEKIVRRKCEKTLCHPDWDMVRKSIDGNERHVLRGFKGDK